MLKKGFTLIEIVIFTAILGVILILAVNSILITSSSFAKAKAKRTIIQEADAVLERMIRETRLANSIDAAGSVFGTNPSRLKLNTVVSPADNTAITKEFLISNNRMALQEGANISYLTSNKISINNFVLRNISGTSSQAVKIELKMSSGAGKAYSEANFYSTSVLRRSY